MKIYEIVASKDRLDESLEMIKGGISPELRLCFRGCHDGDLKPKDTSTTSPGTSTTSPNTSTTPPDTSTKSTEISKGGTTNNNISNDNI